MKGDKKRKSPEKDEVQDPIIKLIKKMPDLIYFRRTSSYQIGRYRVGEPGKWDIELALLINDKIYIQIEVECKKPMKRKPKLSDLRYEQKCYYDNNKDVPCKFWVVINNPDNFIEAVKHIKSMYKSGKNEIVYC